MAEARAMDERLRGGVPRNVAGRTAVVVDDGAATGASVRAALAAVRNAGARQTVIALPVLPRPTAERLARDCDRLVTLLTPQRFQSVAQFYETFGPVSDARMRELFAQRPAIELPA
jgi:putative phosphoribosyl transferase